MPPECYYNAKLMYRSLPIVPVLLLSMILTGCSSQDSSNPAAKKAGSTPTAGVMMAENTKHPLAKYLEVAGFRLSEAKQGRLTVRFSVINHSDADIADLGLSVGLKPVTAAPGEPPFCTFSVKVPTLSPQEVVNSTGECTTTLRVYELPDWQFIRANFQITSPQP
jgi:hypothetical protein